MGVGKGNTGGDAGLWSVRKGSGEEVGKSVWERVKSRRKYW